MGSASPAKIRVAIVGGGIGGLCLTIALVKHNHLDVQVFEGTDSYKNVGAGLAMHGNAIRAMDLLDPTIKTMYFRKASSVAADDEVEMVTEIISAHRPHKGEVIAELGKAKGRKTIARADLLQGLYELSQPDRIHFGKRLASVEGNTEQIVLAFKDGTTASADCVIGFDGIHSAIRLHLLGYNHPATHPVNHEGWVKYGSAVPIEEAKKVINQKWLSGVPILCGPRGYMNSMPIHQGEMLGITLIRSSLVLDDHNALPPTEDFADYSDDARNIFNLMTQRLEPEGIWAVEDHDHAPYFYKDRIAMAGDAAHATLPFSGNGAAQAIEDGAVLNTLFARLKDRSQIPYLFQAYEQVRRPRAQKVVDMSRAFGLLYGYSLPGIGDDVDKMRKYVQDINSCTNDADLQKQNAEAVKVFEESIGGTATTYLERI